MTESSPYGYGPEFSRPLRWRLQDLRRRLFPAPRRAELRAETSRGHLDTSACDVERAAW